MTTEAFKILEKLLAQVAAESYLDGVGSEPALTEQQIYRQGANHYLHFSDLESAGELGMTQATDLMWNDFSSTWEIVRHQKNQPSGFSGTLLYNKRTNTYALSFRSTESKNDEDGGDVSRDSATGANGEIALDGFAWAQILDMQAFYGSLTEVGSDHYSEEFTNYMANGNKLTVTGYSLGGHLAQVFTQLYRGDIEHTYTINGAGMGLVDIVGVGQHLGSELSSLLTKLSSIIENPMSNLALIDETDLDDIASDHGHSFSSSETKEVKVQWFVDQHASWQSSSDDQSSIYINPLYKLAVNIVQESTTGSILLGVQSFFDGDPRNETPDELVTNIYGHADTGDDEFVATSGQRFGDGLEIFIEDQANSNDLEFISEILSNDRHFIDDITQIMGDTHSITLIIDTLYMADLLQRMDSSIELGEILGKLLPSASNDTASTLPELDPDDVEANSHEVVLNGLGRLFLEDWVDIEQVEADEAFGDIAHRTLLHDGISDLRDFVEAHTVEYGGSSLSLDILTEKKNSEIFQIASMDDSHRSTGYRYALVNLLPFALSSDVSGTAADDDTYDLIDSNGNRNFTYQYLSDRSYFLTALNQRNTDNDIEPEAIGGEAIYFKDWNTGEEAFAGQVHLPNGAVALSEDEVPNYLFGDETDNINTSLSGGSSHDRIYGGGGNDSLAGKAGDDYLEGGLGNDEIVGGRGDDVLLGSQGLDTFKWESGDGDDIIADYDDAGDRIVVNGVDLATLNFSRTSDNSPFYQDSSNPEIKIHYDGSALKVYIGSGVDAGTITATQYSPATGQDYGIVLNEPQITPPVTNITVTQIGTGEDEVEQDAWRREAFNQGGHDWPTISVRFSAVDVSNYTGDNKSYGIASPYFDGGPVEDHLTGDSGSNNLLGLAGDDLIEGGAGDDWLAGWAGSDRIFGGDGNDLLFGETRHKLAEGLNTDYFSGQYYYDQVFEDAEDTNTLDGGSGDDIVVGGNFSDELIGGSGTDYLLGGAGQDDISGGADRDIIYGDSTLAVHLFEDENQAIQSEFQIVFADGPGEDYDDVIYAGAGDDTVWGELGDDTVYGGDGNDNLIGDRFNDTDYFAAEFPAYQGTTPELSSIYHGDDKLFGEVGDDLLLGLGGDDFLAGGVGQDSLIGGAGDDSYYLEAGDGLDYVEDDQGAHTLVFSNIALDDLQIIFQGDQVMVANSSGADGFYFSKDQWSQTRIALNTPDALIERSRLDTHYLDADGNLLLSISGSDAYTEAARDELFTIDASDSESPVVEFGAGATDVEIRPTANGAGIEFQGGPINPFIDISPIMLATDWEFLSSLENGVIRLTGFPGNSVGTPGNDAITGTEGNDDIQALGGNDLLDGEDGNDVLDGGTGADTLIGGDGADTLYGGAGHDNDVLQGGRGDDHLDGAFSHDLYLFSLGDGNDTIADTQGSHYFQFDETVDPNEVILYYEGTEDTEFRLQYSSSDWVTSEGDTAAYWIADLRVDGVAIPLVQRSDLEDGTFHGTRTNDHFETGSGNDSIHLDAWGYDVIRVANGDDSDVVYLDEGFYPEVMGEIRFEDPSSLDFTFTGADTEIAFAGGDLTLEAEVHFSNDSRDNALDRFVLTSENDPSWVPTIIAQSPGNLHGSFGTDHIIGSDSYDIVTPGYGHDLIETGNGNDSIYLNDTYYRVGRDSIGQKRIIAGAGNDYVETPLYQGLTLNYNLGDGHDVIAYDWSYGSDHPYLFSLSDDLSTPSFTPYGEDKFVFGDGISLTDLTFVREDNSLHILMLEGTEGSIRIDNFFNVYEPDGDTELTGILDPFAGEEDTLYSFTVDDILALFPRSPIGEIQFSDGSSYSMETVLAAFMLSTDELVLGTPGDDILEGGSGNDLILALSGDDEIEDLQGSNEIHAGEGHDQVSVWNNSTVYAGEGIDEIYLFGSGNTLFSESGSDIVESSGDNAIHTGDGDDEVYLLSGTNNVDTGTGIDYVQVEQGNTTIDAGEGDDYVVVNGGTNAIQMESGNDFLEIYGGVNHVNLGDDENAVDILGGDNTVVGGDHEDWVFALDGSVEFDPGAGNDFIALEGSEGVVHFGRGYGDDTIAYVSSGPAPVVQLAAGVTLEDLTFAVVSVEDDGEIIGDAIELTISDSGDTLTLQVSEYNPITDTYELAIEDTSAELHFADGSVLTSEDLVSLVLGTNDEEFVGTNGNDVLTGTEGDDSFVGGLGNDTLRGEGGDDTFTVEGLDQGYDRVIGGEGFDRILGGTGDDRIGLSALLLADGLEEIDGGQGIDVIVGTVGGNTLDFSGTELVNIAEIDGGAGNDVITGSQGADVIIGGVGNDTLRGEGGDDQFVIQGTDHGTDRVIGGEGYDRIVGGAGDDVITLSALLGADSVEQIDGLLGTNRLLGTGGGNTLDFSGTELVNIAEIDGGAGNDLITGSQGDDTLRGNAGNDTLRGNLGDDTYVFGLGDGADTIENNDADINSTDILDISNVDYDDLWFSRSGNNLVVDVVGSNDQVTVKNWYSADEDQLDEFHASDRVLLRNQVDLLVNAMAVYDVPEGIDAIISQDIRDDLDPTLTAVWQVSV